MTDGPILIVDDDEVLGQILSRVLTQQGYPVERAADAAQALVQADRQPPRLALLDLCLPDQDGIDLANQLKQRVPGLPLILMTAYPLSLREHPERVQGFAKVLTKPLNLQELRQAVAAALNGHAAPAAEAAAVAPAAPAPAPPAERPAAGTSEDSASATYPLVPARPRRRWAVWAGLAAAAVLLALAGLLVYPHFTAQAAPPVVQEQKPDASLVPGHEKEDVIRVPVDVVEKLGIRTARAEEPSKPRPLVLPGSLALDNNALATVHSRFAGEVVELGEIETENDRGSTVRRPIRFGDFVKGPRSDGKGNLIEPGQLLAVVWSKDLGEKKSELADALSQLRTDKDQLDKYEKLYEQGAIPEVTLRQQRRAVEAGLNAVNKAERTLRTWRLPDEEIQAVKDEAERIRQRGGKRDKEKEKSWARVEVRAPLDGVIVEQNVHVGNIVDTTTDLFKVANVEHMTVWAHVYEEQLPALLALRPAQRRWTIRVEADPKLRLPEGTFRKPSYVLDPNQHTALVMGEVPNPGDVLRAGQFVTATVKLPPPDGVVSVPIAALVEDGQTSTVLVEEGRGKYESREETKGPEKWKYYALRRVAVDRRLEDAAYLRDAVSKDQERRGIRPVVLGERVVTQGSVLLKSELEDLQTSPPGNNGSK
jgi:cobalt-zinc-cadmium efflux system membrane fusion protein